jgi:CubicO group peptidase (beta-lactamase class C family)
LRSNHHERQLISGTVALRLQALAFLFLAALCLGPPGMAETIPTRLLKSQQLAAFRVFVEKARQKLQVPGVAVGIIQGDQILLAEGFGHRRLGATGAPDADTLFMVGSTTKPLTSLLLARLVDQGKLSWSTPLQALLPELRLADPVLQQRLRVWHLLCACSGLPRRDLPLFLGFEGSTPAALLASLATWQPSRPLRQTFQYSNQLPAVAGFLAGRVAFPALELGAAYDRAMQEQLFTPLGMTATTLSFDDALQRPNLAWPHGFDGQAQLVPVDTALNRSVVTARPSGGVWSTVNDMLRYVALELREGQLPNGAPYLSQQALHARSLPQVRVAPEGFYGLALEIDHAFGSPVLLHTGSTAGYASLLFWLPQQRIGAVVLTNGDQGLVLARLLQQRLLELLLPIQPEAEAFLREQAAGLQAQRQLALAGLVLPADPRASQWLASRYYSPDLGWLHVRREHGNTRFDFGGFVSTVGTRTQKDGSLAFVIVDAGLNGLTFVPTDATARTLVVREQAQVYRYRAQ